MKFPSFFHYTAGIIDSIQVYIGLREDALRKETLEKKLHIIQSKVLERLHAAMPGSKEHSLNGVNCGIGDALRRQATMISNILQDEEI